MSLKWLPNALTILRCILAFVVGWTILQTGLHIWLPFGLFVIVAATDFLDGYAARKLHAVSAFGAFLDPVADKLLVAISLLALCHYTNWNWVLLLPTAAIVGRDLFVTLIRLRPDISLPVSNLAKWKTAFEMIGIAGYLLTFAIPSSGLRWGSIALIYLAAALSLYTGYLYLRAAFTKSQA
ncbi:MAG: CDP-alcohol phosphatidyltransferase family protein [Henriciella sp.]|nr:CDP-alcohol phosphatidyltransferase family protein [Henriciella sp.]